MTINHLRGSMLALVLATLASFNAQAANVTFSNFIDDGQPTLFDISANLISGNTLTLGLNNYAADGTSVLTQTAIDTITFLITAPAGFFITSVAYAESGQGITGQGVAIATGSMVADGTPVNFLSQIFTPNTGGGWAIIPFPIAINDKLQIAVSITNSLFAFSFGGAADISKTFAQLNVGITPIPLPPAIGLLGAAIVAMTTISTRRKA